MIIVQNSIVSDDVADQCFDCPIDTCRGACCVEGDSGAPLLETELPLLQAVLPAARKYMTPEGIAAVEKQGVGVHDNDGDLGTPLIEGGACAYVSRDNGTTLCAIERAYRAGELPNIDFPKPVSCHLYPIRVQDYGEFTAVNYHRWDICHCACRGTTPLYQSLRQPLIRRFGADWYNELVEQINLRNAEQQQ